MKTLNRIVMHKIIFIIAKVKRSFLYQINFVVFFFYIKQHYINLISIYASIESGLIQILNLSTSVIKVLSTLDKS